MFRELNESLPHGPIMRGRRGGNNQTKVPAPWSDWKTCAG